MTFGGSGKTEPIGHWEIDTVMGEKSDCVVTLVERKTGFVLIGKLPARTKAVASKLMLTLETEVFMGGFRP